MHSKNIKTCTHFVSSLHSPCPAESDWSGQQGHAGSSSSSRLICSQFENSFGHHLCAGGPDDHSAEPTPDSLVRHLPLSIQRNSPERSLEAVPQLTTQCVLQEHLPSSGNASHSYSFSRCGEAPQTHGPILVCSGPVSAVEQSGSLSVCVHPLEEGLSKLIGADHYGAGWGHFDHAGHET